MGMHPATILAVAGTTAAALQTFGFTRAAGAVMLGGNLVVIARSAWVRWAARATGTG
jgi:hypothetical protein